MHCRSELSIFLGFSGILGCFAKFHTLGLKPLFKRIFPNNASVPKNMSRIITPIFLLLFLLQAVSAQDELITVDRMDFRSLPDDWLEVRVELTANRNTLPDARNERYVENIGVRVYLGFLLDESSRTYDFYYAEAEIVIMEQGDEANVYFYLPGLIVERDRLPNEPEFYYAEISVKGETLTPQRNAWSSSITSAEILEKFISNAESKGRDNEHLLMPIYLAPADRIGRVDDLPVFVRRDVEK